MDDVLLVPAESLPPAAVTVRPPRRRLLVRLAAGLATGAIAACGWWVAHLTWLPYALALCAYVQLLGVLRAAGGRLDLGPDGVRIRRLGITHQLAWSEVRRCEVRAGVFSRHVRLARSRFATRLPVPISPHLLPDPAFDSCVEQLRVQCAAYRDAGALALTRSGRGTRRRFGLVMALVLAAVVALDQPWGWVAGGPQADSVPDPCPLVAALAAQLTGPATKLAGTQQGKGNVQQRYCEWDTAPNVRLRVDVLRYGRWGLRSGTWRASQGYGQVDHDEIKGSPTTVGTRAHLGNESLAVRYLNETMVMARCGNVIVAVRTSGPMVRYNAQTVLEMAQDMVNAVHLS